MGATAKERTRAEKLARQVSLKGLDWATKVNCILKAMRVAEQELMEAATLGRKYVGYAAATNTPGAASDLARIDTVLSARSKEQSAAQ